jgi:hypothetical protein
VVTLAELKDFLGDVAPLYSDAVLQDVLDSEAASQAGRCRTSTPLAAPLVQALLRRCQRALALKAMPLGMTDLGGESTAYIPSRDPEIRRLEAPYRKMRF